jgi:hypothetical protein
VSPDRSFGAFSKRDELKSIKNVDSGPEAFMLRKMT